MKYVNRLFSLVLSIAMMLSMIVPGISVSAAENMENHLILADDFVNKGSWTTVQKGNLTGGIDAVFGETILDGLKKTGTAVDATHTITVKAAGTYRVWVRTMVHNSPDGSSTSWRYHVAIGENRLEKTFGGSGSSYTYIWQDGGTVELAAGEHTVSIIDTYKNYAKFNGVFLTNDTALVPSNDYETFQKQLAGEVVEGPEAISWLIRPSGFATMGSWTIVEDTVGFEGIAMTGKKNYKEAGTGSDAVATLEEVPAGTYRVWVHGRELPNNPARTTAWQFQAKVNDTMLSTTFGGGGKAMSAIAYVWEDGGIVTLDEGENTVSLVDTWCDFAKCDAVFVTSDLDMTPSSYTLTQLEEMSTVIEDKYQDDTMDSFAITDDYAGGNIVVVSKRNNMVSLDNNIDPEEGSEPYFYWNFQATSDADRTVTFSFDQDKNYKTTLIGNNKVVCSKDNGKTWEYIPAINNKSFSYTFAANETVRFCNVLPYVLSDYNDFVEENKDKANMEFTTLREKAAALGITSETVTFKSEEGRDMPLVVIGNQDAEKCLMFTSRHHACETIGSYVLEGILQYMMDDAGEEFLNEYCVYAVPMVDIDGVENGEQGKGRRGGNDDLDHNRDYGKGVYPEVTAITTFFTEIFKTKDLQVFIDSHAPGSVTTSLGNHLSYGKTDSANPNGTQALEAAMEPEVLRFAALLDGIENADTSSDKLTYNTSNAWRAYGKLGQSRVWFQMQGAQLATTIETSFTATPSDHHPDNTNRWGKQIGQAVKSYIDTYANEENPEPEPPEYVDDGVANTVDNREESTASTGTWLLVSDEKAYGGDYASGGTSFTWNLEIPVAESYELLWYSANFFSKNTAATSATYTVEQNGETVATWSAVSQNLSNGWHPLGTCDLQAGPATVTVTADSGSTGMLMADALSFQVKLIADETSIVVDNDDEGTVKNGPDSNWAEHTDTNAENGSFYAGTGEGSDIVSFNWPLNLYGAGYWTVEAYIPEVPDGITASTNVSYEVTHGITLDTVTLDHTTASGWTKLGTWKFSGDSDECITMIPPKGESGWAMADALRLTYRGTTDPDATIVIVDNTDEENTVLTGTFPSGVTAGWVGSSTYRTGYVGENYYSLRVGDDDASFAWKFTIPRTGYYRVSISLPDCITGDLATSVKYEVYSKDGTNSVSISHSQPQGYHSLGVFYLEKSEEATTVVKLIGPNKSVCVVDAAMIEFVGEEKPVESGDFAIKLDDPQQTIWGLGVEIQSDSLGSGNTMDPDDTSGHAVPHDLTESERQRLYTDMLTGFRYVRLAGGLFYRGTDEEGKHLAERWDTQDEELAEMLEVSGIEGFNLEFWSPTPYFKSNGQYHGGRLKCFDSSWEYYGNEEKTTEFLEDFARTLIYDFQRMKEDGLPIVQFSLQNEPPLTSVYGTYSFCTYSEKDYYTACKVILPMLKEAFPDLVIHANSWQGQHATSSGYIKADEDLVDCVDMWSWHTVGKNSDYMLNNADYLNSGTVGKPVINNEFEYQPSNFTGQYDFRFVNTAQAIMNFMVFENSPTWYWLHALKPLGNEESLGYSLGMWRKSGDTANYTFSTEEQTEYWNSVEEKTWAYNYPNYNALRGFLEFMPWDSVRYTVAEDETRTDQRIMAWKTPEGQLVFAVTNRDSANDFAFNVNTGLKNVKFNGYALTAYAEEMEELGTKTGGIITATLEPYSIQFWVQEADETMTGASGVELNQTTLSLAIGNTATLSATVKPDNAANKNVRWTSSDSTIATVDENGTVTALKEGTVTITATAISGSGKYSASCKVSVFSEDKAVADAAVAKIEAIGEVKLESEEAIKEARAAYDALTEDQKTLVSAETVKVLTDAEAKLAEIKKDAADKDAADAVIALINAIGEVKLESEEAIKEARAAYDALTDAQKALVDAEALKVLTDAEAKLAQLKEEAAQAAADKAAADAAVSKITAIGEVKLESEEAIKEARAAYDALTEDQKALVNAETLKALTDAEAKLAQLKEEAQKPEEPKPSDPTDPTDPEEKPSDPTEPSKPEDEKPEDKPTTPSEPEKAENPFEDITEDMFCYDAVLWAVENKITTGKTETTFQPSGDCTRAQVVTFLWRAAGEPEPKNADISFPDVAEGKYYTKAVAWAVEKGITNGFKDGSFGPNKTCTRGQIVTFLWRYAGEPEAKEETAFPDVDLTSYCGDAVLWAVEEGITTGYKNGTFGPDKTCKRDQIVTFLYRYLGE